MMATSQESRWIQAVSGSAEPIDVVPTVMTREPHGPTRPQKGVRLRSGSDVLDRLNVDGAPAALWVLGTHGGAGESTISSLLHGSVPASHAWPMRNESAVTAEADRVLLVCRSNAKGLRSAQAAAIEWSTGDLPLALAGLVITADAPTKLPKDLSRLTTIVSGAVPHTWQMPWVEEWRRGLTPDVADLPQRVRAVLSDIQLHTAAQTPTQ